MRNVITTGDLPASGEFKVPRGSIVTPSARDMAAARGVRIIEVSDDQLPRSVSG